MSTEKNIQSVKDFFAAIGRGDKETLLVLVAEDIEWIIPGKDWPLAGTHGRLRSQKPSTPVDQVRCVGFQFLSAICHCLEETADFRDFSAGQMVFFDDGVGNIVNLSHPS